ncbi:OLC1v1015884C1 [Oldenlandia corymbosa var. corymbosa]|uniref:OLC1v1015884C1 n=1 Tax=Oldenlandia corymbosa var. corymbosa TaxID=529605 RepID=A0AAV1E4M5_OLDCO|nr:OLC1v1015884C1 [Oldenlandia corymbosa var. corymbosa]
MAGISNSKLARVTTLVLVGSTGNGKSVTGNSILGRNEFKSGASFGGITNICELQSIVLQDGQILNVIDTPGLFDSASTPGLIEKEILKCIDTAKDGIHAILWVVSLKSRFTEQIIALETMKQVFGSRILDYIIVTFTRGDELEENETNLDEFLAFSSNPLKELLGKCGERKIIFDNKTKDELKKTAQRRQLLSLVRDTVARNGGKPYTDELFFEFHGAEGDEEMKRNKKIIDKLQIDLEKDKKEAKDYLERPEAAVAEEIRRLREDLAIAQREAAQPKLIVCAIL